MTCQTTFDGGIHQRDVATASLATAITTLTAGAMPLVPTIGAMTPLGLALDEVLIAKAAAAQAVFAFQHSVMCFATSGDSASAHKATANASEAVKAMAATGNAESAIRAAMAACVFVFPTAAASVTTAIAEAGTAVAACQAIAP